MLSLTTFLISCFICLIAYIYIKFLRLDTKCQQLIQKLPGPKRLPLVGNAFDLVVPNHELIGALQAIVTKSKGFGVAWLGNKPYVYVANAESAEKFLSSSVHIEKGHDYKFIENWLGTGLLTSKGHKWQQRRKLLTSSFHFKILEDFFDIFNEQSLVLVDILKEELNEEKTAVGDICSFITRCTLDIICETAMGEKVNAQRNSDSEYVKAIYGMTELFVQRVVRPWLRLDFIWKLSRNERLERKYLSILHGFTEQVIQRRKQERQIESLKRNEQTTKTEADGNDLNEESSIYFRQKRRRLAFLDLLLDSSENGANLSDLDIREETDTFMFEGHDTTARSISWTIFLLACNPKSQEKVREEVLEVFSQANGKLKQSDLRKLHYLECCIKEALRLYPSVPFILRHISRDFEIGDGIIIPSGTEIVICPLFIHKDPKYFPNPAQFNPERFSAENFPSTRNPYAYIPFSAGPGNCIGQKFAMLEEKVILANVFRHFWFHPMERLEDIKIAPDIVLRALNGLHVKFTLID